MNLGVSERSPRSKTKWGEWVTIYDKKIELDAVGCVAWEFTWFGDSNVVIRLYDYGEADPEEAKKQNLKARWERRFSLCLDAATGKFVECHDSAK